MKGKTKKKNVIQSSGIRRWTSEEEGRLIRHVQARPQNLHYCFMMVADEIGRSEGAVANHWYQVTSKKPEALCFFTASSKHVSKNRKNGVGEPSNSSIWGRFLAILKNL